MPSTVANLFAAAGLVPAGVVRWGMPVPESASGNYVVALSDDPWSLSGTLPDAPLHADRLAHLLDVRPELRLDGSRPTVEELAARLQSFWLSDEVVLYAGLAGSSVRQRVRQYYKTPLGARRPHAGGWWLKTLTVLDELWVHYAGTPDDAVAEIAMLNRFVEGLSPDVRQQLHDSTNPAPFANLRTGRGDSKEHGITGATGDLPPGAGGAPTSEARGPSRTRSSDADTPKPRERKASAGGSGTEVSQNVTPADVAAGRVRFPRAAKRLFPDERAYVDVDLRGKVFDVVRWDPRNGPDKERSGLLAFGKAKLDGLVAAGERLTVTAGVDGKVRLD